MVGVFDLAHLGKLYPPGTLEAPSYIVTGGSAILCWLHNSSYRRKHADIDLFVLKPETFRLPLEMSDSPFFVGRLTNDGIVANSGIPVVELQIVKGSYFDAEIIPSMRDVRSVYVQQIPLFVLSPEFLLVSKLTYPNVHRFIDFSDVFALNKYNYIQDSDYLNILLMQTSLSGFLDAQDILQAKDREDFQALLAYVRFQVIRQFLYWEFINVEVLGISQCFVLLDVENELLQLSSEVMQLIVTTFEQLILNRKLRQLAMLGYCFLALELPIETLEQILWSSNCREIISHYLPTNVNLYLSNFKRLFMILRTLRQIEDLTKSQFDLIWQFSTIDKIVKRVVFTDMSPFTLWALVRALYENLVSGQIAVSDCLNKLLNTLDYKAALRGTERFGY